jgi:hypothetical protein
MGNNDLQVLNEMHRGRNGKSTIHRCVKPPLDDSHDILGRDTLADTDVPERNRASLSL